jgi:hypothetical protein
MSLFNKAMRGVENVMMSKPTKKELALATVAFLEFLYIFLR